MQSTGALSELETSFTVSFFHLSLNVINKKSESYKTHHIKAKENLLLIMITYIHERDLLKTSLIVASCISGASSYLYSPYFPVIMLAFPFHTASVAHACPLPRDSDISQSRGQWHM